MGLPMASQSGATDVAGAPENLDGEPAVSLGGPEPPLIELRHLEVTFGQDATSLTAIRDFSLSIHRHEVVALLGPSGCGKTTVLRCIAGLAVPSAGSISVAGLLPDEYRRQRGLGCCFQHEVLLDWHSVMGNLLLPARIRRANLGKAEEHAQELLTLMGLGGFEAAYPRTLSGGMRQRLSLARALLLRPELVLLDESFSAVDSLTRETLWSDVHRLWQRYRPTICLVTHSVAEAVFLANRVALMSDRPGTVKQIIKVELPFQRDQRALTDRRFHDLCNLVREAL